MFSFEEIEDFDVGTVDAGEFVVHCHRNKPQVVLGNTEGVGRVKLVSSGTSKPRYLHFRNKGHN